jgi:hypothetical protein
MRYEYLRDCRGGLLLRCHVHHFSWPMALPHQLKRPTIQLQLPHSHRVARMPSQPTAQIRRSPRGFAGRVAQLITAVALKARDVLPGRTEKRGRSRCRRSTAFLWILSWLSRCAHQSRRKAGAFARSGVLVGELSEDTAGRDESTVRSVERASATTRRLFSSACNSTRWSRSNREYQNSFPGISFPLS